MIGRLTGPNIGSFLDIEVGMRYTCDIICAFTLAYGIFSFIFNCGIFFIKENNEFMIEIEKY